MERFYLLLLSFFIFTTTKDSFGPWVKSCVVDSTTTGHPVNIAPLPVLITNEPEENSKSLLNDFIVDTTVRYYPAVGWQRAPRLAFDGSNYLVVWEETCNSLQPYFFYYDIRGARVNGKGILIDSSEIVICTRKGTRGRPCVAYCQPYFLVAWVEINYDLSTDIYATRINKFGEILEGDGFIVSTAVGNQNSIELASNNKNYLAVWVDEQNGSPHIYGTIIDTEGVLLNSGGIPISKTSNSQSNPAIAVGKDFYLVIWIEKRNGTHTIYGKRLNEDGFIIDTNEFPISPRQTEIVGPSIASSDKDFMVIWGIPVRTGGEFCRATYDVYATRLDIAGRPIANPTLLIKKAPSVPSIFFNNGKYFLVWDGLEISAVENIEGILERKKNKFDKKQSLNLSVNDSANFLVVWTDARYGFPPYKYSDIFGTLVSKEGIILDTADFIISKTANFQLEPAVAYNGVNYLIVWSEYCGSSYDIYGVRIDSLGNIIDSLSILISNAPGDQTHPVVFFGNGIYFVAWVDSRNGSQNNDIYGTRISQNGIVLDSAGIPVSKAESQQWNPAIAFAGKDFFVVWEDLRDLKTALDIYGTRITQTGKVINPGGIPISTKPGHQRLPAVIFDGTNYFVVWRDERDGSSNFAVYGARVSPSGKVLDEENIKISDDGNGPSIAYDGENCLVVWERRTDSRIYGVKIETSGQIIDSMSMPLTRGFGQERPIISYNGREFIVLWQEKTADSTWNIVGAEVTRDLEVTDIFEIANKPMEQMYPAIAPTKQNRSLIVYSGFTEFINKHKVNGMRIWGHFYTPDINQ
jgi:hypothetical protein